MRSDSLPGIARRVLAFALLFATSGLGLAQSAPLAASEYARRCQAKVRGMTASHDLSEWQSARIQFLIMERASMIELFAKHGLLSDDALQKKISTIEEVTKFHVADLLSREQMAIWWTWDLRLDEAEAQKAAPRHRLLPTP